MLVQHLLTERLFRTVFKNPDFVRRNAKKLSTSHESRPRVDCAALWRTNQAVSQRISRGTGPGWPSFTVLLQWDSFPG
jgi:hypothetical protein